MDGAISFKYVEEKVLSLRGQSVILEKDVAELYGVETKRVNEAVGNNPDKFPEGYIFELADEEHQSLRSKISTLEKPGRGQHSKYPTKAFTEKGLYMLATILKSPKATQTTIAIVETFTKIRELSRTVNQLAEIKEKDKQKTLMRKSGEILADIIDDNILEVTGDETTFELDLAIVKIKRTVKRDKQNKKSE
jgi:phage regulator Rha-like protein